MKFFVEAVPARTPKTREVKQVAYLYAAILVVFVLAQLFTFDDFLRLVTSFYIPGGKAASYFLASLIVSAEVLALPFLLGMSASPLMRIISMVLGWIVPAIWIFFAVWLNVTINAVLNIGYLGTVVNLMPGWWAVCFGVAMAILAAWASWGMWPFDTPRKAVTKVN
ncbi:MAG: hypothetical protein WA087_03200 [Candidatus Saccharimonadales bacterium]